MEGPYHCGRVVWMFQPLQLLFHVSASLHSLPQRFSLAHTLLVRCFNLLKVSDIPTVYACFQDGAFALVGMFGGKLTIDLRPFTWRVPNIHAIRVGSFSNFQKMLDMISKNPVSDFSLRAIGYGQMKRVDRCADHFPMLWNFIRTTPEFLPYTCVQDGCPTCVSELVSKLKSTFPVVGRNSSSDSTTNPATSSDFTY